MKKEPIFFVIGGANVDVIASPHATIHQKDSNPASIMTSFGGVASNIARNLALLDKRVKFLSVFSSDGFGKDFIQHLSLFNVNLESCVVVDEPSPMYLAMLDHQQDLMLAMVDTSILNHLKPSHIKAFLKNTTNEDVVVFDTNLNASIIHAIVNNTNATLVCDPVSIEKAKKIVPYLHKIDVIKPNIHQGVALSNIAYKNKQDLVKIGNYFLNQGVKEVLLTLGEDGAMYFNDNQTFTIKHPHIDVVNAVGAGDAMLASFVAFKDTYDKIRALKMSVAAAMIACLTKNSVHQELSIEYISEMIEHHVICVEKINKGEDNGESISVIKK